VTAASPIVVFDELTASDVDVIVEIERQSFERPWSRDHFLRELESEISRTVVARDPGAQTILGYLCRWLVAEEVQILNLAVHPDHRRRGIARQLMNHVLKEARDAAVEHVMLEVREANIEAVALYESQGFVRVGRRRDYYGQGEAGVLMTLTLPRAGRSERT
jgi:ribosomal-protein-alanine N-acetyltransferase